MFDEPGCSSSAASSLAPPRRGKGKGHLMPLDEEDEDEGLYEAELSRREQERRDEELAQAIHEQSVKEMTERNLARQKARAGGQVMVAEHPQEMQMRAFDPLAEPKEVANRDIRQNIFHSAGSGQIALVAGGMIDLSMAGVVPPLLYVSFADPTTGKWGYMLCGVALRALVGLPFGYALFHLRNIWSGGPWPHPPSQGSPPGHRAEHLKGLAALMVKGADVIAILFLILYIISCILLIVAIVIGSVGIHSYSPDQNNEGWFIVVAAIPQAVSSLIQISALPVAVDCVRKWPLLFPDPGPGTKQPTAPLH